MTPLKNMEIAVIGDGNMASFTMIYLTCLSAGNIRLIKTSEDPGFLPRVYGSKIGNTTLDDAINMMRSSITVQATSIIDKGLIGNPDVMILATNSTQIREYCFRHYLTSDIGFIAGAACSENDAGLVTAFKQKPNAKMEMPALNKYECRTQGTYTAATITALMLDEARSWAENKPVTKGITSYSAIESLKKGMLEKEYGTEPLSGKKILLIGVGGIGTYFSINALLEGAILDAYDGDTVENTNLDRQFLYYGSVGKKKVQAMNEKLYRFKGQINVNDRYVTKSNISSLKDFDAIACCVDNWKARMLASKLAQKTRKPIVNGGVTAWSASIEGYLAGRCECMTCNKGLVQLAKEADRPRQGCAFQREPNIVLTNAIAGSVMCGELLQLISSEKPRRIRYYSDLENKFTISGIKNQCTRNRCTCTCHREQQNE